MTKHTMIEPTVTKSPMTKPQIRVLIVEDDLVDRMDCRRALAQDPDYEFVLSEAETGRQGLQLAHAQKPDCVLLDYHLPDLNGLEFLAELRNDLGEITVPVMMLTGSDNASVAVEAMKRGAQDYLVKDVERQYLGLLPVVIRRMLREQALQAEKKAAEAKYRALVEQIPAITYVLSLDEKGSPLYVSPQIKTLGFSPEEWLADPEIRSRQIHPDDRLRVAEQLSHSRTTGNPFRCEYRLRARNGGILWLRDEATVVQDESGDPLAQQGILVDITQSKQMEEELRAYQKNAHGFSAHLQTTIENENIRIAREIHDDMGGTLAALNMEAFWLAEELSADKKTAPLLKHTDTIVQLVDEATNAMRRIITGLRPAMLDDLGLRAAIEWHAVQFSKYASIECQVDCMLDKDEEGKLSGVQSTHLFRIFQEALTNVAKHSQASRVVTEMQCSDGEITLSIIDNGFGMPENHAVASNSYGMLGMNERVNQLGGTIKFNSPPGGGFSVMVSLPLACNTRISEPASQ